MKATSTVGGQSAELTSSRIEVPPTRGTTSLSEAEFLRLPPAKGRCPLCGLSRTTLTELIQCGKVKAVKLRKKGAVRGITLIVKQSLLDYLYGLGE
jgi:hypothetical protein